MDNSQLYAVVYDNALYRLQSFRERGYSFREMGKLMSIDHTTLYRIWSQETRTPRETTLQKILDAPYQLSYL